MNLKTARNSLRSRTLARFAPALTQAGIGLIEVLIAVLVLAIGILGIAAVQTRALANNNSSMGRTMATVASYSILDAMRIDRDAAMAGDYDGTVTADSCPSGATLAKNQLQTWCKDLGERLGATSSTSGKIKCDATTGDCEVTIQFDDSRSGAGGNAMQTVVTNAGL